MLPAIPVYLGAGSAGLIEIYWGVLLALMKTRLAGMLARSVNVREDEIRTLLLSFAYFFCLLCGYYILRPLREEMGVAGSGSPFLPRGWHID